MVLDTQIAQNDLDIDLIRRQLSTRTVGQVIYLFGEVSSTNERLRQFAREGAREGTVLLAESQSDGRGRLGKKWFSPFGVNLYASVLFRPHITPKQAPVFSFIASLALADAIREIGAQPAIKWPNDILVERKKVAGALVDLATSGELLDYVILGVGVNLNVEKKLLLDALGEAGQAATSLREVKGIEIDRNAFAASFLNFLDEWFHVYRGHGESFLIRAWQDLDILTGRRIAVKGEQSTIEGRVIGVDAEGYLLVRDPLGRRHQIIGGEIRLLD